MPDPLDTSLCPAGWHRDLFRTAPGAPCVVTTRWLSLGLGLAAVGHGLWSVGQAAIVVMLRRSGKRWLSFRMVLHVMCMLGVLSVSCGSALLWRDLRRGLADPHAAWRLVWALGYFLIYPVAFTMLLLLLLLPAVQIVGGLDPARSAQLGRWAKLLAWAFGLCFLSTAVGNGMAFLGTAESFQGAGAATFYYGGVGGTGAAAIGFLRVAHLLQEVLDGLDPNSSTAKQIAGISKVQRAVGLVAASYPLPLALILCVGSLRALSGVLLWYGASCNTFIFGAALPYFEYTRLHATRLQRPPMWARSFKIFKVHAGEADTAATATATAAACVVADHAARASEALLANPPQQAAVRAQQARPEGLAHNGVSLALMARCADEYGVGADTTAAEVCARHVKPATDAVKLSLVAVLQGGREGAGAEWVGAPTHFISYAWYVMLQPQRVPLLIPCLVAHEWLPRVPSPTGHTRSVCCSRS